MTKLNLNRGYKKFWFEFVELPNQHGLTDYYGWEWLGYTTFEEFINKCDNPEIITRKEKAMWKNWYKKHKKYMKRNNKTKCSSIVNFAIKHL